MRFLRTNTAVIISVGPFLDATDGITPETGLTITAERITLVADTDDNAAPTLVLDNVTGATSGTANDLNYITGQDNGMMQMELSAANTNRLGRMLLTITDAANHCPVIHELMVLPAMIYDSLISGTDALDASVIQWLGTAVASPAVAGRPSVDAIAISGDTVAADNVENAFDETAGPVPWIGIIDQGTAQSATGTTVVLRAASAFGNDTLKGMVIAVLGSDQGYWQTRLITGSVLATDTVTVDAFGVTPTGTITYKVWGAAPGSTASPVPADVRSWLGTTVATPGTAGVPSVDAIRHGGTVQTGGDLATLITAVDDFVDTEVAAIFARIGAPAGASIAADIAAIAAYVDTEVAAILTAVGVPATPSALPDLGVATLRDLVAWIALRNGLGKRTFNKSTGVETQRNEADNASLGTATHTDNGTTVTRPALT